jgi:hypothetical protein
MLEIILEEKRRITYDGSQLSSHWIFRNYHVLGDALLVFRGPCAVSEEKMVDLEDVLRKEKIKSSDMLHFLVEIFGDELEKGVLWQRFLVVHLLEVLQKEALGEVFQREGDDIYLIRGGEKKKLTISIATKSPVSILIHLGVNIDAKGAPVPAVGLNDLKIAPFSLARKVSQNFKSEFESVKKDALKVKPVR